MNRIAAVLVFLLSLLGASSASGETLFGPHQYTRISGGTGEFADTFTATAGQAMLFIENGEWDGEHRVDNQISSARIFINNTQIFGPSDFNQNVHILKTNINLVAENTITVELNSSPESFLTVRITRPAVTVTADPEEILPSESSTLYWDSSDIETCKIEPGIGPVAANGTITVSPAETTTYTITATDPVGMIFTASQIIRVNHRPVADAGPDQTVFRGDTVNLDGSGSSDADGDSLSFQWSFVSVPTGSSAVLSNSISPDPTFVPDVAGIYEVQLIVSDGTSDSTQDSIHITVIRRMIEVPVVVGLAQSDAEATIIAAGLMVGSITIEYSDSVPEGKVINQNPGGGTLLMEGSAIELVVSSGSISQPPTVTISANPPAIIAGSTSTLTWNSTNGIRCMFGDLNDDGAFEEVPLNGSIVVSPTTTNKYVILVLGSIDYSDATIKVTVLDNPNQLSASLNASMDSILSGDSSTLSWYTTNAESVIIDHGIGSVDKNGSIRVSPTESTIYTITAKGAGGSVTDSVWILVKARPTVNISASPQSLSLDEPVTLSWSTTKVDACIIEPGAIDCNKSYGSITAWPTVNTTYTITGTFSSGSVSDSVSVLFKPPTVSFSADTYHTLSGQGVTLNWETTNADSVSIDNGVGNVGRSGSMTIFPSTTTTYTITVIGPGGTDMAALTVDVLDVDNLGVLIISPAEYDVINIPQIQINGIVASIAGEVGVTVNGYPAQVHGNMFFVNNLPLVEGENTITATATEPDGSSVSNTVTVIVDTSTTTGWIDLSINPENGITPLTVNLTADRHFSFSPEFISLTHEGPGELTVNTISDNEYELHFSIPGIYTLTYTVTDDQGVEYKQEIMVNVFDLAELDAALKAKWEGMKSALVAQDVESGLAHFLETSQDRYRQVFNALLSELPQIVTEMENIEMIYALNDEVKYRINQVHDVDGIPITITYYLYFSKDHNGIWKIEQF